MSKEKSGSNMNLVEAVVFIPVVVFTMAAFSFVPDLIMATSKCLMIETCGTSCIVGQMISRCATIASYMIFAAAEIASYMISFATIIYPIVEKCITVACPVLIAFASHAAQLISTFATVACPVILSCATQALQLILACATTIGAIIFPYENPVCLSFTTVAGLIIVFMIISRMCNSNRSNYFIIYIADLSDYFSM